MGDTEMASGAPETTPGCSAPTTGPRRGGHRRRALPGDDPAARQVLLRLCTMYYQSLVRLAALLTGDAEVAEQVAADSLAALFRCSGGTRAPERDLVSMRREVVIRSRRMTGPGRPAYRGRSAGAAEVPSPPWQSSPVVRALPALPSSQREAVVLTLYLDLSDHDAAAILGVSPRALRRDLARAQAACQNVCLLRPRPGREPEELQ